MKIAIEFLMLCALGAVTLVCLTLGAHMLFTLYKDWVEWRNGK